MQDAADQNWVSGIRCPWFFPPGAVRFDNGRRVRKDSQMDLEITDGPIDAWTHVIEPHGEIDLASAGQLKECVNRVLDGGVNHLIVDLVDVHFIDSTGLGILLAAHNRLQASGGALVVACADSVICRIFTIAGVKDALNVQSTRRAALEALAQIPASAASA